MNQDNHQYIDMYCENCGEHHSVRLYCGSRLCEKCKQNNYYRLLRFYVPVLKKINRYRCSQITLTYKNFQNLNPVAVASFKKDFLKLRNTKFFKNRVRGGLAVIECKHKGENYGWNLHVHIIVDSLFICQKELKKEWSRITKHSYIVDVRKEENNERALKHLLKYFLKKPVIKSDFKNEKDLESSYDWAFKKSRNIISFGSLYSSFANLDTYQYKCPKCGESLLLPGFKIFGEGPYSYKNMATKVRAGPG